MFTIYERVNSDYSKFNNQIVFFLLRIIPTVTELNKLQSILNVEQIYFPLYMRTSYIFEIICIMIFSIELNLRIISTPKISLIFYDIFNYLDLVNYKKKFFKI